MGNCCLPIRFRRTSSAVNPKNVTLLLLGLDNAGKTTIAKRLAGEPVDSVVPTVGFSVLLLRQRGCHVSIYDLGGGPQIRDIWPRYFADAHGIIFVTDAHDTQKLEECRQVLENVLQNEMISGKPILLLANKQDLEGALDEIDIVDKLNLEKLVNERKCPTLVELCSALNFSKKMDLGIENGYKWLIRSIIRDYPSLNNRVLKDLARQDEENRVHVIKRQQRLRERRADKEEILNYVDFHHESNPFVPVKRLLEDKSHLNGTVKIRTKLQERIPGLIDDLPEKSTTERRSQRYPFTRQGSVLEAEPPKKPVRGANRSSDFFVVEQFRSDIELLNDLPNQPFKSFLVRPKSSGARLYGIRSEKKKKKTQRRKPLRKGNKTGPCPLTDISNDQTHQGHAALPLPFLPVVRDPTGRTAVENVNPLLTGWSEGGSRSTPGSRRSSAGYVRKRRYSTTNGMAGIELSPLKVGSRTKSAKGIILDVKRLAI